MAGQVIRCKCQPLSPCPLSLSLGTYWDLGLGIGLLGAWGFCVLGLHILGLDNIIMNVNIHLASVLMRIVVMGYTRPLAEGGRYTGVHLTGSLSQHNQILGCFK